MVGSRVYIGNLPRRVDERDLQKFFKGYGHVRDVLIKNGYGFVELEDARDADDACHVLNGKRLLGERVTVERARGLPRGRDQFYGRDRDRHHPAYPYNPRERTNNIARTNHRLIVENLSSRVSWQDLKDYMRQAGDVTYADAHKYKNEGLVEFASYSDMKNALEKLDDTEINGRRIRLVQEKKRKSASSSRSRSRSRSKRRRLSGSKSRSRSTSQRRSPRSKSKSPQDRSPDGNRRREPTKSRSRTRSRSAPRGSASGAD